MFFTQLRQDIISANYGYLFVSSSDILKQITVQLPSKSIKVTLIGLRGGAAFW